MDAITREACAKINLGLDVVRRRADGYHEVDMLMQTIDLVDTVTVTRSDGSDVTMSIHTDPAAPVRIEQIPIDERNLCVKAACLLRREAAVGEVGLHIDLVKRIPAEAGLAGGSTDGAAVLAAVNALLSLGMSREELAGLAVRLGADVPYCLYGGTMRAQGIGEVLTTIVPPLQSTPMVLVKPDFGVSTRDVYEAWDALTAPCHPDMERLVAAVTGRDEEAFFAAIANALEEVTLPRHRSIGEIQEALRQQGAAAVCMSGSGPTVFGLFRDAATARTAADTLQEQCADAFVRATVTTQGTVA